MITICDNSKSLNLQIFHINKKEDILSLSIYHFLTDHYLFTLRCIKVKQTIFKIYHKVSRI